MRTDNKSIDVGKVRALHSAGWGNERIAYDMGISEETVEEVLQRPEKKRGQILELEKENEPQPRSLVVITSEELCEIYEKAAAIGAKEALKAFEQERKKEYSGRANRRLRNTKLLLRNYHMLKEHAENSVFGRTQMEESAFDILESMMSLYDNEVIIESIKRSATRTAVMVAHIETMFGLYAAYCDKSAKRDMDMRRYEVVWDMYMAEDALSAKEIAEKHHISVRSVYEDVKAATEQLSSLIFGVDGLNVQ